jgi:hypothetical protein
MTDDAEYIRQRGNFPCFVRIFLPQSARSSDTEFTEWTCLEKMDAGVRAVR